MNEKFQKPDYCKSCKGCNWSGGRGFVPASGTGDNGVLILGEAAGEHEAQEGQGFVGKAGLYLFQNLQRAGIYREGFKIDNIVHCRPPANKLAGEAYEADVINSCKPYLEATIREMQEKCRQTGKTFTILTLGKVAFKAVMGLDDRNPIMRKDYIAYPFRHEAYQAWVIPAYHPSFLMRGKTELVPILQFATQRALEIADKGLQLATPDYLLDPSAPVFENWVEAFLRAQSLDPSLILSYDIETPMKQGTDEEEVAKEDDDDYTILRVSFSYRPNEAVSIPWRADYLPALQNIFKSAKVLCGWNSQGYDRPRIESHMPVLGAELDGMLMWHVLNSALPKGLGFVTPFYVHNTEVWKYLSDAKPAFYNAKDADMALQVILGIKRDLTTNNLWPVFDTHVLKVHEVFHYMSQQGVVLDMEARKAAEERLSKEMIDIEARMEATIPKMSVNTRSTRRNQRGRSRILRKLSKKSISKLVAFAESKSLPSPISLLSYPEVVLNAVKSGQLSMSPSERKQILAWAQGALNLKETLATAEMEWVFSKLQRCGLNPSNSSSPRNP
jgi:uracil-DNA glycosylase family 4